MAKKIEENKLMRRNRKGQLTRTLGLLESICATEDPTADSIKDLLKKAEQQYSGVEEAHSALVDLLKDEDFEKEEKWMYDWQKQFVSEKQKAEKKLHEIEKDRSEPTENPVPEAGNVTKSTMDEFKLALELPKAQIPPFNGDPTKFWAFVRNFEVNVEKKLSSDEARLSYLVQLTTGKARDSIECCLLLGDEGYNQAREILKTQFGQHHVILHALMDEMVNSRVSNNNSESLWALISKMKKGKMTLEQLGYGSSLGNPENLLKIQKLLPFAMQKKWAGKAQDVLNNHKEPTFQEMIKFLEREAAALNNVFGRCLKEQNTRSMKSFGADTTANLETCPHCSDNHRIWQCDEFRKMTVDERWGVAAAKKLCFKCLGPHQARVCKRKMHCGIEGCSGDHNRLLHKFRPNSRAQEWQTEQREQAHTNVNTAATMMSRSKEVALRTVPVMVKHGDKVRKVNAILDDGSTQTYINAGLATELGLMGTKETMTVEGFNGQTAQIETMPVQLGLRSMDGKTTMRLHAMTTNHVTGGMRATEWCRLKNKWHHLSDIPFEPVSDRGTIDILIGTDYPELHLSLEERVGKRNEPVARLTPLGWTCVGRLTRSHGNSYFARTYKCEVDARSDELLRKFWEVENTGLQSNSYTREEQQVVTKVADTLYRTPHGKYGVKLPWKEDPTSSLPQTNNYEMAKKRLDGLERRFQKNETLRGAYEEVIKTYVEKQYVSKIQQPGVGVKDMRQCYLPHFPVIREDKETTKVRVVFDASAGDERHQPLNDKLEAGPKLHRDLFDVLLRFRKHKIALICDISEMYLQIEIAKEDRPMLRFLWRENDTIGEPEIYEFNRLPFGVNVAPFIAQYVAQHNAQLHAEEFPLGATTVLKSTYMDDSMDSVTDAKKAMELYEQLVNLWGKAGMSVHKWVTNDEEVMGKIPTESRAKEMRIKEGEPSVKALGLTWAAEQDIFSFNEPNATKSDGRLTKRNVLSRLASVFDPLGFLSPITTSGKILMQRIWADGLDWDETMEGELAILTNKWSEDLKCLSGIRIPRCLCPSEGPTELHTFVDASEEAYAAVVYLCCTNEDGKSSRIVASKAKVAPLKSVSIPRMELMSAVLGVRLTLAVINALEMKMDEVHFWSDSMNVLYWLRNRSRAFKSFVANRIGEIQESTNPTQWRHVPSKLNPADVASRGTTVEEVKVHPLWWEGPEFIKQSSDHWPTTKLEEPKVKELKKKKLVVERCNVSCEVNRDLGRLDPTRYSRWLKLVRVRAYVTRYISNCRQPREDRQGGELTVDELQDAKTTLIRAAQHAEYRDEIKALARGKAVPLKSPLSKLNPINDEDGLLRSSSRLSLNDTLPYDARYPIILPRKHPITRLIVRKYHEDGNHVAGVNHTLALLSSTYWVVGGREEIREAEANCSGCRRTKARAGEQIMAPLPRNRTELSTLRAFDKVSVDFAGPFLTKQGRGKIRAKRYLCLFTCMKTRAVHLEIAFGLDTDSFLNCLFRFVSRRGNPSEIRSDNGTNFIGARNELNKLNESIDKSRVERKTSSDGINWKWTLNPPLAPHFGGVHESLIKSAKRAIYAILENADITDEELLSAIVGAEGLMNSRPITYQSSDAKDDVPLTPNHFLHGQIGGNLCAEVLDNTSFNPRRRWRRVQELIKHVWQRWISEYLPTLSKRSKWNRVNRDLQVNDVVMILERGTSRGHWPLGRVLEVFNGPDGHVRVVRLKTSKGELTRAITSLSPLEVSD